MNKGILITFIYIYNKKKLFLSNKRYKLNKKYLFYLTKIIIYDLNK